MGRRTVLLIVAALIAVMGSSMVFLYVQSADSRARAKQDPVQVLTAVQPIAAGETLGHAQSTGKLALAPVPRELVLDGAMTSVGSLADEVALEPIYPHEQIITAKFGTSGSQDRLSIPKGMIAVSASLNDTGRVAGFVSPGSEVSVFLTGKDSVGLHPAPGVSSGTRLLLPKVTVIAVAQQTLAPSGTTTNGQAQGQGNLPPTLFTFAVTQKDAQKLIYASQNGTLSFGLLTDTSTIRPLPATTGQNLFK